MKRVITLAFALLLVFACGKDQGNGNGGVPEDVMINSFASIDDITIAEDGGAVTIPVTADPESAILSAHARVSCNPEGIVDVGLLDHALRLTPRSRGTATVTVAPKEGPGSNTSFTVTVSAPIVSIRAYADAGWASNRLTIGSGESIQMKTTILNEESVKVQAPVTWKLLEGGEWISLSADGVVKGLKGEGVAVIRCEVSSKPEVFDEIEVRTVWAPEQIVCNEEGWGDDIHLSPGGFVTLKYKVLPEKADQNLSVSFYDNYGNLDTYNYHTLYFSVDQTKLTGEYSLQLKISYVKPCYSPHIIRLTAERGNVTRDLTISVDQYSASWAKPGDYVYYNPADGTFRASDCGRRMDSRFINGGKKEPSPKDGEVLIGVLARVGLPDESVDFLASKLYKTASMVERSDLKGFTYASRAYHGLVLAWEAAGEPVKWQGQQTNLGGLPDQSWGYATYHYMLKLMEDSPTDLSRQIYPVKAVQDYAAKHSVGTSGTTGWFLPGRNDLMVEDAANPKYMDDADYYYYLTMEGLTDGEGNRLPQWLISQFTRGNATNFAYCWNRWQADSDGHLSLGEQLERKSTPLSVRAALWL